MRVNILGTWIDTLTMAETMAQIEEFIAEGRPRRIITANPELVYRAQTDRKLQHLLNTADLVTPDGVGIVWAAKALGAPVPERVTGIDILTAFFPVANRNKWRVFLLGAAPGVAAQAVSNMHKDYPDIVFAQHHGFFGSGREEQELVAEIKRFKPDLLAVGLGAPRQEYWISEHYLQLETPVEIGVGGSFDVLSGRIKRAPDWIRRLKLEWFARLIREPKRWKRQLNLPKFVLAVARQRRLSRRNAVDKS
ncbi:MAG TPA: WecB/TagA/CpsF family glycosyltransferase [Desulfobacteria bacterium]|nr:WecB/TagA/CpsF family glycosyltransferase [Desulfobacteria bacterium]